MHALQFTDDLIVEGYNLRGFCSPVLELFLQIVELREYLQK